MFVGALVAAGYQVYAINPLAVSRYRDRHSSSRAKSDRGDAKVLADLVRTDRHNHRPVAGDSTLAEAVKVLARTHQSLVWTRQRQLNQLRSLLREFYPGALAAVGGDLGGRDALAILAVAPTPDPGPPAVTGQAGRDLRAEPAASAPPRIAPPSWRPSCALRSPGTPAWSLEAFGAAVTALVGVIATLNVQLEQLTDQLQRHLTSTRTPRSCVVCPDLAWSSAPGWSASSAMTRPATTTLKHARPMPAPPW